MKIIKQDARLARRNKLGFLVAKHLFALAVTTIM